MSKLSVPYRRSPGYTRYFLLVAGVALLLLGGSSSSLAQPRQMVVAQDEGLFREATGKHAPGAQTRPTMARNRLVTVDLSPFSNPQGDGAATLSLNLFPDVAFTAVRERARTDPSGSVVWAGPLQGVTDGYATLVVNGEVMSGNITMPGASYEVRYAGDGAHTVYKVNYGGYPPEHPEGYYEHEEEHAQAAMSQSLKSATYPAAEKSASLPSIPSTPSAPTEVDLIVLWTPKAQGEEGGAAAAAALIDLAVEEANNAYAQSGIDMRLKLVYKGLTNYAETLPDDPDAYEDDLSRLTNPSDGFVDEAHGLRERYGADMVSLLISNDSFCGLAWQLRDTGYDFSALAFSVVHMPCASGNLSLAHELGHNMGSLHDRVASAGDTGVYNYSYGYHDVLGTFRTIMAYPNEDACPANTCARIAYFSNPDVLYNGRPTGRPANDPLSANNALTLNNLRSLYASWRTAPVCQVFFEDVPAGSTYYESVRCLACSNILGGYPCGGPGEPCDGSSDPYFRVNNNITRGQIAKVVSNAADFNNDPGAQIFADVPASSPFFTWINRLSRLGHMSGYACGGPGEPCGAGSLPYFRPNANASRGQLSKIVSNAAGLSEAHTGRSFEDVPTSSPFYVWIQRLSSRGYISGYPCGGPGEPCGAGNLPYFRPGNLVTRGQASKIVANTFFPGCSTP
ncbi:MAG: S-layer homology domain-containing protein [Chloroflexota bacterium]|nr:S-layer homology domain-containing protein [Chloroflexota bacterium]